MNRKGFTLVEIMVSMAIIAVLAMLIVGAIILARNTAKETIHRSNARTLQVSLEAYYTKHLKYPDPGTGMAVNIHFNGLAPFYPNEGFPIFDNAPECDGKEIAGWSLVDGGGLVSIVPQAGYTIRPADANCDELLTEKDFLHSN